MDNGCVFMNSNENYKFLILLVAGLIISGCAASLTPIEVSERFWTAVKNKDANNIRKYISSNSQNENVLSRDILPLDEISLGKTIIDGEEAWVDTNVIISGDDPFIVPLKTVLLQENNLWKVDYDKTVASLSGGSSVARVMSRIADLSAQFTDELNHSIDDIQEAIPKIQREIEIIEENVKEQLPVLRERMEEFMKQLEEALGEMNKRRPSKGTTEI